MSYVLNIFENKIKFSRIVVWSDSAVTLNWLNSPSYRWRTFVANRVAQIQEKIPFLLWRHVASEDNPSDCASRGLFPSKLVDNSLWWAGPEWLSHPETLWPPPKVLIENTEDTLSEEKRVSLSAITVDSNILALFLMVKILKISN